MRDPIACRQCGSVFTPSGSGPPRYCPPCKARAAKGLAEAERAECRECGKALLTTKRTIKYCSDLCRDKSRARRGLSPLRLLPAHDGKAECRVCGKTFPTPSRAVRYCSDACRGQVYARYSRDRRRRGAPGGTTVSCRVCGKDFATDRGPGQPKVYCSAACRAEGSRARNREYMRRYYTDTEKRVINAARISEAAARRRAALRAHCKECGKEFQPTRRTARYCSDPCREKGYARDRSEWRRRQQERDRAAAPAARCRVCSREFALGYGAKRLAVYCSDACRAEGLRTYYRERARRLSGKRDDTMVARCRVCSKDFAPGRAPGYAPSYCSEECRAESRRTYHRERARRLRGAGAGTRKGGAQERAARPQRGRE